MSHRKKIVELEESENVISTKTSKSIFSVYVFIVVHRSL